MRPSLSRAALTVLALGAVVPAPTPAQLPADTSAVRIIRRVTEERWVHEGAPPEFVPADERVEAFHAREIRSAMLRNPVWAVTTDLIDADAYFDDSGHIRTLQVRPPALLYGNRDDAAELRRTRVWRLQGWFETRAVALRLPSSRFRELWVPLPREDLAAGARWTDTLTFVADPGEGLREAYRSLRHFEVLGDTMTEGGRALRVRMDEEVQYEAADLDVFASTFRRVERTLAGRTHGIALVDPGTMLRVGGADTARWEGKGVLHDSVSGPLTSGIQFERVRTWARYDSASYESLRDSMRAARERASTGMLFLPRDDLEQRLRAGEPGLADSLIERWRVSRDPDEIRELRWMLQIFDRSSGRTGEELDSLDRALALARGDIVAALSIARRLFPYHSRLTVADVELALPYLEHPERLWRLGEPARYDYGGLASTLMQSTPIVEPDTARWRCVPAACDLVIERGAASSEPRLRDAALVGRFARDPARWFDSLVTRQDEGATLVTRAIRYGRGIAVEGQPAVPESRADWTAWRRWWDAGGRDHSGSFRALRFYEARTGRDPIAELAAAWPPEGDSARVALGEILRAAHAVPPPTVDEVRTGVLSGDSVRVRRAAGQIQWGAGERVDVDSVASVLVPLLDSIFAGAGFPWPVVSGAQGNPSLQDGYATSSHGVRDVPTFLLESNIPGSVRANPPPGVTVITREAWQARDLRAGGHLFEFAQPQRWGPFLSLTWEWTALRSRAPDEAPKGYAGGATLILVQTDDRWRVVRLASWIT